MVEHVARGRVRDARLPNDKEIAATGVLALSMDQVSLKSRAGPPNDLEGDRERDCWAGVVPVRTVFGEAEPAGYSETPLPEYLRGYRR